MTTLVHADDLRESFSSAMSRMYRQEVPAYGTLVDLVVDINQATLNNNPELNSELEISGGLNRLSAERHGAIRLGTASELSTMRRMFAVLGMLPVGYYDLSVAGIPVHSTAFRPVTDDSLAHNAFRVFTSLLRLELIEDAALRKAAQDILQQRQIFTAGALELLELHDQNNGLTHEQGEQFIQELLETFRWHQQANVDAEFYHQLHNNHRLIADVVSFKGPHINHLTPRTLDIDAVQSAMPEQGITPKAVIEGPPKRQCPLLLRQTSFKAIEEPVQFQTDNQQWVAGQHTARFGEIEQRGLALTPKGRELYDQCLAKAREQASPAADGSNANEYKAVLEDAFAGFPDDWNELRSHGLGYFRYVLTEQGKTTNSSDSTVDKLINDGLVEALPIIYEDFLPVSAAGIFQSNLGDEQNPTTASQSNQTSFEYALGAPVLNEFEHYAAIEAQSLTHCLQTLTAITGER